MPGLSAPIRYLKPAAQLNYFPWQRYQTLRQITQEVDDILNDLQQGIAVVTEALQAIQSNKLSEMDNQDSKLSISISSVGQQASKDKQRTVSFIKLLQPYALSAESCEGLNNYLGVNFFSGGSLGKWLAFLKPYQWNKFHKIKQEMSLGEHDTHYDKIKNYDHQLSLNLIRVSEALKSLLSNKEKCKKTKIAVWNKTYWMLHLTYKRIISIHNLYFDTKNLATSDTVSGFNLSDSASDTEKSLTKTFGEMQKLQSSRYMTLVTTMVAVFMAIGLLGTLAASGIFGAPLAILVGWGGMKTLLAPFMWGVAHVMPTPSSWFFIPVAVAIMTSALTSIHSTLFSETTWRLSPFQKPHLQNKHNDDLTSYRKAIVNQLKHLKCLRLPSEKYYNDEPYATLNDWQIVFKTLCNPLRLSYAILSLLHGMINFSIDVSVRIICSPLGILEGTLYKKMSRMMACVLKAPIDCAATLVSLVLEIMIKATDVIWNWVLPTLGKIFFGIPQAMAVYFDYRAYLKHSNSTLEKQHGLLGQLTAENQDSGDELTASTYRGDNLSGEESKAPPATGAARSGPHLTDEEECNRQQEYTPG